MGAVQQRLVKAGLASQTALGAAASAQQNVFGLTGGKVYDVELDEAELDTTWDTRAVAGFDRVQAVPIMDLSLLGMPQSIGTLLNHALGSHSVTGAGPYTHVFTVGTTLPYATGWGSYGASDSAKVTDAKCDSLELSWDRSGAVQAKVKYIGCGIDPSAAFPTPGAGVSELASAGVLKGAGGTFSFDGATARVTGGSIKISNAIEAIVPSNTVLPADVIEGKTAVEIQLKVKPTDLTAWRKALTGASGGTAAASAVFTAAVDIKFIGPASSSLEFTSSAFQWATSMPDANPSGGAAELTLTGRMFIPTAGAPLTVTLINSIATY